MLDRRAVALARHGQPFGSPYHGVVRANGASAIIDLPNGETMTWPTAIGTANPWRGAACYELTRPGMPSVATTPAEAAEGKEWRNRALITDGGYWGQPVAWPAGTALGDFLYIYIAPSGNRWRIDLLPLLLLPPVAGVWVGEPTISITARRWGTPVGQVRTRDVQLPSLAALGQDVPLSAELQAPPGFTVGDNINVQMIDQNADGSKLILRLTGGAQMQQGGGTVSRQTPVGYWLWETSADAEDELSYSLTELRTRADTLGTRANSETNTLNQVSGDSSPVLIGTSPGPTYNDCDYGGPAPDLPCCIAESTRKTYGPPATTYTPYQGDNITPPTGLWDGQRTVEIGNTGVIVAMFFDDAGAPADVRVDVSMTYDMSASFSWQFDQAWVDTVENTGEHEGTGDECKWWGVSSKIYGPGWADLSVYSESRVLTLRLAITIGATTYEYVGTSNESSTGHHYTLEGRVSPLHFETETSTSGSDFSAFVGDDEITHIDQITMDIADGTLGWSGWAPLGIGTYGINFGYYSNRAFGIFTAHAGSGGPEWVRYNEILSPAGSDGQVVTEVPGPGGSIPEHHACYNPITHEITRGPSIRSWA